jgi:hypothetical protein
VQLGIYWKMYETISYINCTMYGPSVRIDNYLKQTKLSTWISVLPYIVPADEHYALCLHTATTGAVPNKGSTSTSVKILGCAECIVLCITVRNTGSNGCCVLIRADACYQNPPHTTTAQTKTGL